MTALAAPEHSALAAYDRHLNEVYNYLYYRTGQHATAQNLTRMVFERAVPVRPRTRALLLAMARNLINRPFRLAVGPADVIGANQDLIRLLALIQRLPNSDQAEVLILRIVLKLTVDETARVMRRRDGAIRMMQSRALDALAQMKAS